MTLVPLPAVADNHIWMLQEGRDAIMADPGDAKPVPDAPERGDLQLAAILVTHRARADHVRHIANFLPPKREVAPRTRLVNPYLRSRGSVVRTPAVQANAFAALHQWNNDF